MLGDQNKNLNIFLVTWMWSFDDASQFHFWDNNSPKTFYGHFTMRSSGSRSLTPITNTKADSRGGGRVVSWFLRMSPPCRRSSSSWLCPRPPSTQCHFSCASQGGHQPRRWSCWTKLGGLACSRKPTVQPKFKGNTWYLSEVNKQWTGRTDQVNRLSLKNNRLKFKTPGN